MRRIVVWSIVIVGVLTGSWHRPGSPDKGARVPKDPPALQPGDGSAAVAGQVNVKASFGGRTLREALSKIPGKIGAFVSKYQRLIAVAYIVLFLIAGAGFVWFKMFKSDWIAAYAFNYYSHAYHKHARLLNPIINHSVRTGLNMHPGSGDPVDVTFKVNSFDPSSGLVHGQVQIRLAYHWSQRQLKIPRIIYVDGSPANIVRSPRHCPRCIQYATGTVSYQRTVYGTSAAFPSDQYLLATRFDLQKGAGQLPSKSREAYLLIGPKFNAYDIQAQSTGIHTNEVFLLLSRPASEVNWYYAIALAPVALIMVLIWQLATQKEVTLEAGIGILAILSLRQVLVPSNITGITRIDILLGIEAVAMIVLVAVGIVRTNVTRAHQLAGPDATAAARSAADARFSGR